MLEQAASNSSLPGHSRGVTSCTGKNTEPVASCDPSHSSGGDDIATAVLPLWTLVNADTCQ
jgi:hypothetical protein